jgi:hypothetical protein
MCNNWRNFQANNIYLWDDETQTIQCSLYTCAGSSQVIRSSLTSEEVFILIIFLNILFAPPCIIF